MHLKGRTKKEHAAATKIQALWRAFFVRRSKHNKAATTVQRMARGFIVRRRNQKFKAAVTVQRHVRGLVMRRELERQRNAATMIQKRVRGKNARQNAKDFRARAIVASIILQRAAKRWKAYQIARAKRAERDAGEARQRAATRIQSVFRGNKGRERFDEHKRAWLATEMQHKAATKVQAHVRRVQAERKVEIIRQLKLETQHHAATVIRKFWLRCVYSRRYQQLQQEFRTHLQSIVTIQRYVRGYIVRLRMWRDAIRCEEELWAAVEVQRCWRGYVGRVRWEVEYDSVHSRLVAAMRLQRHVRGWLARTRAHRIRKRNARADFERARRRFKAAQRIQALVRARQCRKRIRAFKQHKVEAVTRIQRVHRGHRLRCQLWEQAIAKRTVQIQAAMRGFLVRNRRFHVLLKVICIQHNYRKWLRYMPEAERARRVEAWRQRRLEAKGS